MATEEYIGLYDNKYIGDLLVEFKAGKDRREIMHCKLVFKMRIFRESDEAVPDLMFIQLSYVQLQHDYSLGNYHVGRVNVTAQLSALQILADIGYVDQPESFVWSDEAVPDLMFIQLSYVQLQHDYSLGNYPVGRVVAAQLSALQILADIGYVDQPESFVGWTSLLERYLPRQIANTRAKGELELAIISCLALMEHLTKDDARQQFLKILRSLPYGNAVFFSVRKIDDPFGLRPGRIILGINKHGVHFFRPVPREHCTLQNSEISCNLVATTCNKILGVIASGGVLE